MNLFNKMTTAIVLFALTAVSTVKADDGYAGSAYEQSVDNSSYLTPALAVGAVAVIAIAVVAATGGGGSSSSSRGSHSHGHY